MKQLIVVLAYLFAIGQTYADPAWVNEDVDGGEIIEEIKREQVVTKKTKPSVTSEAVKKSDGQNIYIVNQNKSRNDLNNQNDGVAKSNAEVASSLDNQPATVVEASPLVESYATNLRAVRQNAEIETEQKIVEKLEASRLQDERDRAARLFGDSKFKRAQEPRAVAPVQHTAVGASEQAPIQIIQVERVVEKQPAPVVEVIKKKVVKHQPAPAPVVVNEVSYERESHVRERKSLLSGAYVGLGVGNINYKASNVESKYAWSLALGTQINPNLSVEASFMYSQHRVDELYNGNSRLGGYGLTDLDQYNLGLEGKYSFVGHQLFKPYVGAYVGATKRNYYGVRTRYSQYGRAGQDSDASTRAFNLAPVVGVDFAVNKGLSIGLDYRYMMSMAQKYSTDELKHSRGYVDAVPLEEINYSVLSVQGKIKF